MPRCHILTERQRKALFDLPTDEGAPTINSVKRFIGECRRTLTILPGVSIIERLCADALVAAERRIETRIVDRLNDAMKDQLDALPPLAMFTKIWKGALLVQE